MLINSDVDGIITRIPGWVEAQDLTIEPLEGITNESYRVAVNGERFVLRISRQNTVLLGVDRKAEQAALEAVSRVGIGPEVVHFIDPEGHLVTRYIKGRHWSPVEYRTPENLRRIVETVKRLHALPTVKATFSPFRLAEVYVNRANALQAPLPDHFDAFMNKMRAIEANRREDPYSAIGFCHNDLISRNFLDDGTVRILDWEWAGMGDIYFDLAALVISSIRSSLGPLSPELQAYVLECYFGEINVVHQARLEPMKFMFLLLAALWGVLHHGMVTAGVIPPLEDFNYLQFSELAFAEARVF